MTPRLIKTIGVRIFVNRENCQPAGSLAKSTLGTIPKMQAKAVKRKHQAPMAKPTFGFFGKLVFGILVLLPGLVQHHVGQEYPEIPHGHNDRIEIGHPFDQAVNFL